MFFFKLEPLLWVWNRAGIILQCVLTELLLIYSEWFLQVFFVICWGHDIFIQAKSKLRNNYSHTFKHIMTFVRQINKQVTSTWGSLILHDVYARMKLQNRSAYIRGTAKVFYLLLYLKTLRTFSRLSLYTHVSILLPNRCSIMLLM